VDAWTSVGLRSECECSRFVSLEDHETAEENPKYEQPCAVSWQRLRGELLKTFKASNSSIISLSLQTTEGHIVYKDVYFRYPTRKGVQVLEGLNLEIPKGKTVALVGPSGCGKSTCMQLLLRYYDPEDGSVDLDKTATTDYPLSKIRAKLGLVSQEPILFDRTIAENIAYGDNERKIPMVEIIEAAKAANIHDFISKLPQGYETGLGSKGEGIEVETTNGQRDCCFQALSFPADRSRELRSLVLS
jgi:ABC-type multidrug transport system fused ATPase/permease subunit